MKENPIGQVVLAVTLAALLVLANFLIAFGRSLLCVSLSIRASTALHKGAVEAVLRARKCSRSLCAFFRSLKDAAVQDAMLGLNPDSGTDNSWQALDANGYYFYCHPLQVIAVDSL